MNDNLDLSIAFTIHSVTYLQLRYQLALDADYTLKLNVLFNQIHL